MTNSNPTLIFRIYRRGEFVREERYTEGVIKIGKHHSYDMRLEDDLVSRMHAVIEVRREGAIRIVDLGSASGTLVNRRRVNRADLTDCDEIDLGETRLQLTIKGAAREIAIEANNFRVVPCPECRGSVRPHHESDEPGPASGWICEKCGGMFDVTALVAKRSR